MSSRDHSDAIKAFTIHTQSWWCSANRLGADIVEEIMVGLYPPDGGTSGEFCFEWVKLGNDLIPRLRAYDDGWSALAMMPELIFFMYEHDSDNLSPEAFVAGLKELGFRDFTKRNQGD